MGGLCTCQEAPKLAQGVTNKNNIRTFQEEYQIRRRNNNQSMPAVMNLTDCDTSQFQTTQGMETGRDIQQDTSTLMIEDEAEELFQRNAKMIKLKQQNINQAINRFRALLVLGKHSQMQDKQQMYLESLDLLQKKVRRLDPHSESYNSVVSQINVNLNNSSFIESTPSPQDKVTSFVLQSPGMSAIGTPKKDYRGIIFDLEYKLRKIQESYEHDIIQFELQKETQQQQKQKLYLQQLVHKYDQLRDLPEEIDFKFELLRHKASEDTEMSKAQEVYLEIKQQIETEYYQQVINRIKPLVNIINISQLNWEEFDEQVNQLNDQYLLISQEIELISVSQHKKQQQYRDIQQQINTFYQELNALSQGLMLANNSVKSDLFQAMFKDQSFKEIKKQIGQGITLIKEGFTQFEKEFQDLLVKYKLQISNLQFQTQRSSLIDLIDSYLMQNQQLAQDLEQLCLDPSLCLSIESSLLSLRDTYWDIEEDKGYLEEQDQDQIITQLLSILQQFYKGIYLRDKQKIKSESEEKSEKDLKEIEDIKERVKEEQQIEERYIQVQQGYLEVIERVRLQTGQIEQKDINEIHSVYKEIQIISNQGEQAKNIVIKRFETSIRQLFDGGLSLNQEINDDEINQPKDFIIQLQQRIALLQDKISILSSIQIPQSLQQPPSILIITTTPSLSDKLLSQLLQYELDQFTQQSIIAYFPTMFSEQTSDQQSKVYCLVNKGLNAERQSVFGEKEIIRFKTRIIEGENLCLKMSCGLYIQADRIGQYQEELQLKQRYGFIINNN